VFCLVCIVRGGVVGWGAFRWMELGFRDVRVAIIHTYVGFGGVWDNRAVEENWEKISNHKKKAKKNIFGSGRVGREEGEKALDGARRTKVVYSLVLKEESMRRLCTFRVVFLFPFCLFLSVCAVLSDVVSLSVSHLLYFVWLFVWIL
jgi:hypothetical protein